MQKVAKFQFGGKVKPNSMQCYSVIVVSTIASCAERPGFKSGRTTRPVTRLHCALVQLQLDIRDSPYLVGLAPYSLFSASVRSRLGLQNRRQALQGIPLGS